MSCRRTGKALIQLLYFVARAWIALTTPCVAQSQDGLASGITTFARCIDCGIRDDDAPADANPTSPEKIFCSMSIRLTAGRLQPDVARRGMPM